MNKLSDLIDIDEFYGNSEVTDITDDSRKVIKGGMFVAIRGNASDGNEYIQNAINNGAKFIVTDEKCSDNIPSVRIKDGVIFINVNDTRKALADLCSKFWKCNFENVAAITGTNGKSSTVDIIRQIWIDAGINAASIGTLGVITKDSRVSGSLTSPGSVGLHLILSELSLNGVKNVAMEASSHGLSQNRLDGIKFSACGFTNFSQDHLDYHKTFENYWRAKERLFSELADDNTVIVANADDAMFEKIQNIALNKNIKCVGYGKNARDIKLMSVREVGQYQDVKIELFGRDFDFRLSLAGGFQVYNSLCAMGICYLLGTTAERICETLEKLQPIDGRLELVGERNGASIYVDYAHTPDALKNAILSLRKHTEGKLTVVFGCGGERDAQKREIMGSVANNYADLIIVTDDNPRSENPQIIREMILKGCPRAQEIPNRSTAIKTAVESLHAGDILLIAGKGHEDYQILASGKIHFSDKEVVLDAIK